MIFNKINIRLKRFFHSKLNSKTNKQNSNKSVKQAEIKYISIPYIKNVSKVITSSLRKNEFIVGYRCLNQLGWFIKVQKNRNT